MAPATKESTREHWVRALNGLNAALEDFDDSRSQDAFNLDSVQERIRATTAAYGQYVSWHNRFLDFSWEEAATDVAHEESMAALKKINDAKAQFLALKRASSGVEPSAPRPKISSQMAAVHAAGVDPEGDAYDPNPGSASGQADSRGGDRENARGDRSKRRGNGRGGGRVGGQDQRQEESCPSCTFPHGLNSYQDCAEMDVTGRWEFVKANRFRALCF